MERAIGIGINVRRITVRGFAWILLSCLGAAVFEQPEDALAAAALPESSATSSNDADRSSTKIRVNSDLVVIPVTVTDGKGRVVNGLQKEHFTLYDDKVEQVITQFAAEDAPVSIGLVFDASDSMGPKLPRARDAVAEVLNDANPKDEFFLVQFNHRPQLVVSMTTQTEEIRRRVELVHASGSTAVLDAVALALNEMRNAHHNRKAIIIVSDGEDNASSCSVYELMEAVREADVLIYAIGTTDAGTYSQSGSLRSLTGSALLNKIAEQTGGRLFEVNNLKQLPDIASKIGALLRNQYVLAYSPNDSEKNGRYHYIQIKLEKPKGFPRLHASWRRGYYAPRE